jgi:hypothetical protein
MLVIALAIADLVLLAAAAASASLRSSPGPVIAQVVFP